MFKKQVKKYAPVAVRIGLMIGSTIIFSQIIYIPHVFTRIVNVFEPVNFLIKAVSYPIEFLVTFCGESFILIANNENISFYWPSSTTYFSKCRTSRVGAGRSGNN